MSTCGWYSFESEDEIKQGGRGANGDGIPFSVKKFNQENLFD
jgi:hypothetical protein